MQSYHSILPVRVQVPFSDNHWIQGGIHYRMALSVLHRHNLTVIATMLRLRFYKLLNLQAILTPAPGTINQYRKLRFLITNNPNKHYPSSNTAFSVLTELRLKIENTSRTTTYTYAICDMPLALQPSIPTSATSIKYSQSPWSGFDSHKIILCD